MRRPGHRAAAIVLLVLVAALIGACTGSTVSPASPASSAGPTSPSPEPPSSEPAETEPVTGEVPPAVLAAAKAELATIVGADAAAGAVVVSAEAVDWPDSSLGCPQPDMMYLQVITPGYQVVFEVGGVQYDMRAAASGGVVRCEPAKPVGG